ncbi:MAG: hypothetical protein D6B26_01710 [Spirochaetaceae bacterium]|nr:MAG: hypothetical protein D6B26_01710 [Spirochaetaceae bacterium]
MLIAAIIASYSLIALQIWYYDIVHIITPFLMPILSGMVWIFFLCTSAWTILRWRRYKSGKLFPSILPFAMQLVSFIIVLAVPFSTIMLDLDFRHHLDEREFLVQEVLSGKLTPNVSHNQSLISLPPEYQHLSKGGGEIIVEQHEENTYIFFYTYRGVLDNFSGFMYRSDNSIPQDGDFDSVFAEIKAYSTNWYWTASN